MMSITQNPKPKKKMGNSKLAEEIQNRIFQETGKIVERQMRSSQPSSVTTTSGKDFFKDLNKVILTDKQKLEDSEK